MLKFIITILLISTANCARDRVRFMDGIVGPPGAPGQDGSSCSAEQLTNGALITCTNGTSAFISNGADGANGIDGTNGQDGATGPQGPPGLSPAPGTYDIVAIIEPCAATNSEVLLRLRSGHLLAHYSHGSAQFLAILQPGTYQLTDTGPHCTFTVGPAPFYVVTGGGL